MYNNKYPVKLHLLPFLTVLASVCFFKPFVFPTFLFLSGSSLILFIIIMMFGMNRSGYRLGDMPYKNLFILYAIFLIINTFSCHYFREQSVWLSFKCIAPFFLVFIMPTFKSWKLSNESWEKILLTLFAIYIICNYLQYIFIDTQLFYLMKEFERMETEKRAVLFGEGILSLGALMCLNRYLLNKQKKYLIVYIAAFFLIFLHGFRMVLLGFGIASLCQTYAIIKFSRKWFAYLGIALITTVVLYQMPAVQEKIKEIETRSESSSITDENYARYKSWYYFNNAYFKNDVERFLGSGQTIIYSKGRQQNESGLSYLSKYSKERSELVYHYYIWSVDWGLIGLSWDCGIPFTIVFILILFSMFRQKVRTEHRYINFWALMLMLIGVTGALSYTENIFIYYAVLLTIIDRDITDRKRSLIAKQ